MSLAPFHSEIRGDSEEPEVTAARGASRQASRDYPELYWPGHKSC